METQSIWNSFAGITHYPVLQGEMNADIVIIGGGITGLSNAQILSELGFKVIVLEANKICGSTTSHSTGNIYCSVDQSLDSIKKKYDEDVVKKIIELRSDAINLIIDNIKTFEINCDLQKVPWVLYSSHNESNHYIEKEFKAMKEAGLAVNDIVPTNTPYPMKKALVLLDQAQFNPMKYGQGLAFSLSSDVEIYENSPAVEIEEHKDQCSVSTPSGKVNCKYIIHATHTPKGVMGVQTMLGPYREYGISCRVEKNDHPKGIYWGHYENDQFISTRTYNVNNEKYLIVVGRPHKVGQSESSQNIKYLEDFATKYFNAKEFTNRWGGQHYRSTDLLPFIGPTHNPNIFIATGFSTDGLVWGSASALIIKDLITKSTNEYTKLVSSARFAPLKSVKNFVTENVNVLGQYLKDLPGKSDGKTFSDVTMGEGKIIEKDGQKLAVFRDSKNHVCISSAICTHLECVVNWNDFEKSWDCPCHGSRFSATGEVLEGPAIHALDNVTIDEQHVNLRESL